MKRIAKDVSYKCPEPILLIVGGTANDASDLRAFVFMASRDSPLELSGLQDMAAEDG